MISQNVFTLAILILCFSPLQGTLVQYPSHSCFQENVTFMCTYASQLSPNYFVNIINTILNHPTIDPSRLISSSSTTSVVTGFMSQNLTLIELRQSEASAIILCISVLWSNLSNATTSIQVESNSVISLEAIPPTISYVAISIRTESSFALAIQHSDVVYRQDVLQYRIAFAPFGSASGSRAVSYDDLSMEIFSVGDVLNTCYMVSVNSTNCMGRGEDFSTNFILPRLTNGSLTRQSQSQFCWTPADLSSGCPGPNQVDLSDNLFSVSLIRNSNILRNLTVVTTPNQYCFTIPDVYLGNENLFARLYINGVKAVSVDVSIPMADVFPSVSTALRIVTIVVPSVAGCVIIAVCFSLFIVLMCFLVRRKHRHTKL